MDAYESFFSAVATRDSTALTPLAALVAAFVVLFIVDCFIRIGLAVTKSKDNGQRWFFLHSFANFAVVVFGLNDVLVTIDSPVDGMNPTARWSQLPGGFVAAVHLYHLAGFKVNAADLFHHLVFAGVGNTSNYLVNYGPIANMYFFFICGLPGCIDYFLLGLVRCGVMDRMTEKRVNSILNVWLRAPGLTLVYGFGWAAYRSGNHALNIVVVIILLFISIGNGQYYLDWVVRAHERAIMAEESDGKQKDKKKVA